MTDTPDPERLLTPAELEIMQVLWAHHEGTVHEVMGGLGGERAYTTISTLLRILEQKGFVVSRKQGRQHVYAPTTPRPVYEATSLRTLVQRVFEGDASALVRRLLDSGGVDAAELERIRRMIETSRQEEAS